MKNGVYAIGLAVLLFMVGYLCYVMGAAGGAGRQALASALDTTQTELLVLEALKAHSMDEARILIERDLARQSISIRALQSYGDSPVIKAAQARMDEISKTRIAGGNKAGME